MRNVEQLRGGKDGGVQPPAAPEVQEPKPWE